MAAIPGIYTQHQPSKTTPVANPTWFGEIRYMFTDVDNAHMGNQGLDLTNYDTVVASANAIYSQVAAGLMPPKTPWPSAWAQTFLNWLIAGFPKGSVAAPLPGMAAAGFAALLTASRIRRDVSTLSAADIALVAKAFTGMMTKASTDPDSYFAQAGIHWLPAPLNCLHHVPAYNPWHRAFLKGFENAMRSVPGCEAVTLPYWDITRPLPDVLKNPPFDKYTLPANIGGGFNAGYTTERHPYPEIQANLVAFAVNQDVERALQASIWEDFHGAFGGSLDNTIIRAHDGAHVSIGPTMASQAVAAFDPIFWFFHCNWDRLFWQWQQEVYATTLAGLLTTISDPASRDIFMIAPLMALDPFSSAPLNLKTIDTVDSAPLVLCVLRGRRPDNYQRQQAARSELTRIT